MSKQQSNPRALMRRTKANLVAEVVRLSAELESERAEQPVGELGGVIAEVSAFLDAADLGDGSVRARAAVCLALAEHIGSAVAPRLSEVAAAAKELREGLKDLGVQDADAEGFFDDALGAAPRLSAV